MSLAFMNEGETGKKTPNANARQAFFATFSSQALKLVSKIENPPKIMLTGGFVSFLSYRISMAL